ncbi:MAG: hypothetical protein AB7R90_19635 [Reyranellaceae bacterium]
MARGTIYPAAFRRVGRRLGRALAAATICLAGLGACSSIGPGTVTRDRVDYGNALASSWKEQLLQNIVRLRYADTPQFMDISSVVAGYALQGTLQAGYTDVVSSGPFYAGPRGTASIGATGTYLDRPTISYTPLAGRKFTQSLLEPLQPVAIFSLIAAGYPVDLVFPMTVRALNGVYGRTIQAGVTRPSDPEFAPLVEAMRRIQQSRAFSIQVTKTEKEQKVSALFDTQRKPEIRRDADFVARTLRLTPRKGEFSLVYGAVPRDGGELAVLSRSMIEILAAIAADIQVPERHAAGGLTHANSDDVAKNPDDLSRVRILSGASPPADAFAAVKYSDAWFWIANNDLNSKRAFTFLTLFFALAETGAVPAAPVLTIPVQ